MEQIVNIEGCNIWTISEGQGIPFLLCNGGPGCDDYLKPVSRLVEDICQVIRFEARGCGRSDYDGQYELERTVEDMEHIRKAHGIDKWIVGGHSAGPDYALAYTISYPDRVLGIIGIAGGRIVNDRDWSAAYHANKDNRGEDMGVQEFKADPLVNKVGNRSWKAYIKRPNLLKDIAQIQVPAVFIGAGQDIRPTWPTQQLAALIPKGEYMEIAEAAHYIWLTHAKELGTALQDTISKIIKSVKRNGT